MRLGLVGYGLGGRYFHAPFIEAADGVTLAGVVTRSPNRRAELASDFPNVPAFDSLGDLLDAGVDAVTITTPAHTRRELVLQAIAAGVPTIADKPFAPTAEAGRLLVRAAADSGVPLTVFHNRRWDGDARTVAKLLRSGVLGSLWSVESRFELNLADHLDRGPEGGLLRDLGAHLVDQMVWLLGPVESVLCAMDWLDFPEGSTDAFFTIFMRHRAGVRSTVTASKINRLDAKEYRVYGSDGSYVCRGTDVQAASIFAGERPASVGSSWGYEAKERWGVLSTSSGSHPVPSEQGAYHDYYTQFAAALRGQGALPVPAAEAIPTLEVLDAARLSESTRNIVTLPK